MLTEIGSTIKITDPSPQLIAWCKDNLVLANPDYQKKVRMHLWVGNTPKKLFLYSMNGSDLILPFGCLRSILPLLEGDWKKLYRKPVKVDFGGKVPLYDYQEEAVAAIHLSVLSVTDMLPLSLSALKAIASGMQPYGNRLHYITVWIIMKNSVKIVKI